MENNNILEVQNLCKTFDIKATGVFKAKTKAQLKAVDDVSFHVKEGETLGLIGESGCGKSTLARMILGILPKTSGNITYRGKEVDINIKGDMRKNIQMIFQDPYSSIDPRMNVERIIAEPLRVHTKMNKDERRKEVIRIMEITGLSKEDLHKYPHEFSGGQRQRIGIARALVMQPEIILCDEPVSSLDVSIQAQILNLLKEIQKDMNLTSLFITHDMCVVKHISDRIAVMYLGNIIELAEKREFFGNTLHPYSKALIEAIPMPNPEHKRNRSNLLRGEVPSPINRPTGCPFRLRCDYVKDICVEEMPPLKMINENHYVACHVCGDGGDQ